MAVVCSTLYTRETDLLCGQVRPETAGQSCCPIQPVFSPVSFGCFETVADTRYGVKCGTASLSNDQHRDINLDGRLNLAAAGNFGDQLSFIADGRPQGIID
jgi:hypothetical protein